MSMPQVIELSVIEGIVAFAMHEKAAGGHIAAFIVGKSVEEGGIFANAVPTTAAEARMIAVEIHSSICLDWVASGKKNPRSYQITIKRSTGEPYTERRIALAPEETKAEDALGAAMHAGLIALNGAASAIRGPYDLLKDLLEERKAMIAEQAGEIQSLRGRVVELEGERRGAVDQLLGYLKAESESHVHGAQAEAITIEAKAKAKAWGDMGQAALVNAPRLLQICALLAGLKLDRPPPGLAKAAAGIAGVVGALKAPESSAGAEAPPLTHRALPPAELSPEAVAALRAFGASLTPAELGRLVKFARENDPASKVVGRMVGLLEDSKRVALFSMIDLIPVEWMSE